MTSLIDSLRTYLITYSGLADNAPMLTDVLGKTPTQYAIVPLPGEHVIATYINDATLRAFPFALQSMESVADETSRLANYEFYEAFAAWIEQQNKIGTLPTLGTSKTSESIEVLGQPILFEFGESGTGIYQIQCRLVYEQNAP
jgi:hypothetical protein